MLTLISLEKEHTAQKMKFSWKISSLNVTKSAVSCGFGHIYLETSLTENFVFCAVCSVDEEQNNMSNNIRIIISVAPSSEYAERT